MTKQLLLILFVVGGLVLASPTAQAQDDTVPTKVTIRQTIEEDDDGEQSFLDPAEASVSSLIEFFPYGPWNIDIGGNEVTFAWDSDPEWDDLEGELPDGTFERYYLDFEGIKLMGTEIASSSGLDPTIVVLDSNSLLVEFGAGMNLGDGQAVTISLDIEASDTGGGADDSSDTDGDDAGLTEEEQAAADKEAADKAAADKEAADKAAAEKEAEEEAAEEAAAKAAEEAAAAEAEKEEEVTEAPEGAENDTSDGPLADTGVASDLSTSLAVALLATGGTLLVGSRRAARRWFSDRIDDER